MYEPLLVLGIQEGGKPLMRSGEAFVQYKHITGISGSGKSLLIVWIVLSLLRVGVPVCVLDPAGDLVRLILGYLVAADFFRPDKPWADRLWYLDFSHPSRAVPFNVLAQPYEPHITAAMILDAMKRVYPTANSTAAMDNVYLATLYLAIKNRLPITKLSNILLDKSYRMSLLPAAADDPEVCDFLGQKLDQQGSQVTDAVLRRCFDLTFSPVLRRSLSQSENLLSFRDKILDTKRSVLINLACDDFSTRLLGCLIMAQIERAFLSRSELPSVQRTPCHVVIDEFPMFSSQSETSFSRMLELIRKEAGTLYLVNQTDSQLSSGIAGSLQNALTVVMKQGPDDSQSQAARYFRKTKEVPADTPSLIDLFFGAAAQAQTPAPSAFAGIETLADARHLLETLKTQEGVVRIGTDTIRIKTPSLPPPRATEQQVKQVEEAYAQFLLRPVAQQPSQPGASFTPTTQPGKARRRVARP